MNRYLPTNRVRWTDGLAQYPIWPSEPDVEVIKDLVASALDVERDFSVRFLAQGSHHKVYEVSHPSWSTMYLFRVAVAVFPFYKMESEMATLEFLRQKTSIPVPKPIAWSSSAQCGLGYEWALLERLPGVELRQVWNDVPLAKKLEISQTLATFLVQLWEPSNRFSKIGSLYFKASQSGTTEGKPRAPNSANPQAQMTHLDNVRDNGFVIGPMVNGALFAGHRLHLRNDHGPYNSCHDWLDSLIRAEERSIRCTDLIMNIGREQAVTKYNDTEWNALVDEVNGLEKDEWPAEFNNLADICKDFRHVLPQIFPRPDGESQVEEPQFCLFHCDLRTSNILIDPKTFAITGIIDWEQTSTVPDWFGMDFPKFMNVDSSFLDVGGLTAEDEPPIPETYDVESPNYDGYAVLRHQYWEAEYLRDEFDLTVEELLGRENWQPKSLPMGDRKLKFVNGVHKISTFGERARASLRQVQASLRTNSDADGCLEKEVSVYLDQRRWKEAEDLLAHCLKKSKVTLGTQDPKTLNIMASLALTLRRQDRWDEAERLETQVLEVRNTLLGRWHPDTLNSMSSLAETYTLQGRFFAAKNLEKRALVMRTKVYGENHPATLRSTAALAKIYGKVNRSKHGMRSLKRVLATNKRLLGDDHLDTLSSMADLADLACHYSDLDLFIDTEKLGRRVLEKRKALLGDEHPDTLNSMASLARLYNRQRRFHIAIDMQVPVLETRERLFGAEHCDTLNAMADLSTIYHNNRRLVEAEELQLQVLETRKRLLGVDHPTTLAVTVDLISTYSSQYQWHKAMPLRAQVLKAEKTLQERRSLLSKGNEINPLLTNDSQAVRSEELSYAESVGAEVSDADSGYGSGGRSSPEPAMTEPPAHSEDASAENLSPALGATKSSSTDDSQEPQGKAKDQFPGISAAELISIYAQLEKNEAGKGVEHVPAAAGLLSVDGSQGGQGEQEKTDELLSLDSSTTRATSNDSSTDAPGKAGKIAEQTTWTRRLYNKRGGSDLEHVAKRQSGLDEWYKSVYEEACTIM